jgi:hypothetical protein
MMLRWGMLLTKLVDKREPGAGVNTRIFVQKSNRKKSFQEASRCI